MQHKIGERAQGRWKDILPALGVSAAALTGRHGPCPVCGGKDRFRFDDKEGKGTWFCNQSHNSGSAKAKGSAGNGFALLMDFKSVDFAEAARLVETVIGKDSAPIDPATFPKVNEDAEAIAEARAHWRSGIRVKPGDPVDLYLKSRLGSYAPTRAIKFIPATALGGRMLPAMVSAYVDVHGDLFGVQRTFLTMDGRKAGVRPDRWNSGRLPAGGAIRLAPHRDILGIAEGVETALAATALYQTPCWAALNDGRLLEWEPPESVKAVVIFADNDKNHVGQAAAYALAKRLETSTRTADVMLPPDPGTDWNDVLQLKLKGMSQ